MLHAVKNIVAHRTVSHHTDLTNWEPAKLGAATALMTPNEAHDWWNDHRQANNVGQQQKKNKKKFRVKKREPNDTYHHQCVHMNIYVRTWTWGLLPEPTYHFPRVCVPT